MSLSKELRELSELHKAGELTDVEFEAAKARVLGQENQRVADKADRPTAAITEIFADRPTAAITEIFEEAPPRPLGLTIYASLNLAVAAWVVFGASLALMDPVARKALGMMPPMIGLAMASVLIGASAGLLKGAPWGRTLLICYAAAWLLGKVRGWNDLVMDGEMMTGQDNYELVLVLKTLLVLTWLLFPLVKSKWMGFGEISKKRRSHPVAIIIVGTVPLFILLLIILG